MKKKPVRREPNRAIAAESGTANGLLRRLADSSGYICIALLLVAGLCYANSLSNKFVFDDHDLVLSNRVLRSLSNTPRLVMGSYRPMRDLSYMIDFAIWGENPLGFHLTNVILHIANVLLAFFLIRKITKNAIVAVIAALVFAVHPIQTDAVAYISGRRDVLFAVFYLASFYFYLANQERKSLLSFGLFGLFWALSLMSKEMAASLPLLILVWNFCMFWKSDEQSVVRRWIKPMKEALDKDKWLYLGLAIAAIAYTANMLLVKRASIRAGLNGIDYWGGSFWATMLTSLRVQAWYLKQLIFPTPIAQYFGAFEISNSLTDWRVWAAFLAVSGVLTLGFISLKQNRLLCLAILSYFALLAPVSQIIPHHELLADHYLYLPMLSFGLVVGLATTMIARMNKTAGAICYSACAVALVSLSIMTVLRNRDWKDEFTVWQKNYESVPQSPRAAFNLASQYLGRNPKKAQDLLDQALRLDTTYAPTYIQLAQVYLNQNRFAECEELINRGLALPDSVLRSVVNREPLKFRSQLTTALAVAKGKQGDESRAEELLNQAISLYSANPEPYEVLAAMYRGKGRAKEIEIMTKAVAANPYVYETLKHLTFLQVEERLHDEAVPYLQQMLRLVPSDFYASYQLGQIYRQKGECQLAKNYLNIARSHASGEETKLVDDAFIRFEKRCGRP